jgi:hypothetical protein
VNDRPAIDDHTDPALEYLRAQDRRRGIPDHISDRRALEDGAALLAPEVTARKRPRQAEGRPRSGKGAALAAKVPTTSAAEPTR